MDIRLNKLISDAGICSRREADSFILTDRVTVNGKQPRVGQKVTVDDEVLVDGERLNIGKYIKLQEEQREEEREKKEWFDSLRRKKFTVGENQSAKSHKTEMDEESKSKSKRSTYEEFLSQEASDRQSGERRIKLGKQPFFINPKSSALRKTSRNSSTNRRQAGQQRSRNRGK